MNTSDILERIRAKSEMDEEVGCEIYQGATNDNGYGLIYCDGKTRSTHRLVYEATIGEIPPGFDVHHLCAERACCCIDHLQVIPHRLNVALTREHTALRWQRLQDLFAVNSELYFLGTTRMTSTDLSLAWGKNCKGSNLVNYLKTLAFVFEGDFEWSLIEKGKGCRPHLFKLHISESLRERLERGEHNAPLILINSLTDLDALPAEF